MITLHEWLNIAQYPMLTIPTIPTHNIPTIHAHNILHTTYLLYLHTTCLLYIHTINHTSHTLYTNYIRYKLLHISKSYRATLKIIQTTLLISPYKTAFYKTTNRHHHSIGQRPRWATD